MRVLGFDPGTATTGYGVVEAHGSKLIHIAHGTIVTAADLPFGARLKKILLEAQRLLEIHDPDAVAIEKLFFSRNVTTALNVAQARGVLAVAVELSGKPIGEFSPLEVKNAVVGYGKADKRQVQEMVKILLGLDKIPRPDDAADALAIAICQLHAGRIPQHEMAPYRSKGSSRPKSGK